MNRRNLLKTAGAAAILPLGETMLAQHVADIASEQFVAMVRGHDHLRSLLGLPPVRNPRSRTRYLEACVDAFLKAYVA